MTEAINFLTHPDPRSRSPEHDGRRLVKEGQFQYRMVNWARYEGIKSIEDLREYNRRKQAEYRARKKLLKSKKKGELSGESVNIKKLVNGEITQEQFDAAAAVTREGK